ncbi:MAG: helix-turn-helix transcriptional regulator [Brachyspira sp.]|nr:helix-turn-helix transcriptional regulator [Brachyspira sp.]
MNIKATREIIATNLRKFRAIKRISQEELAELSDLSQQYICSIENAKVNPSIFTMMKIAEALNVSVNDLIY